MADAELNKRYCQSCGMPLRFDVEEYLGTNLDCSPSDEFCYYCLKDGKYIADISMLEIFDSLDMDELISMSRLSKFHFRRIFKAITGENIASYIQRLPKNINSELRSEIIQIPNGRYAVFQHTGSYASLHKFYQLIYEEWFPEHKYRPKSTFSFEIHVNNPRTTNYSELITEIYIPIEKV